MDNRSFDEVVENQLAYCKQLLCSKGEEYDTTEDDRLHAFKVAATLQHTTPRQALAGMMAKHSVSVYDMCADDKNVDIAKWTEKITDSINYLLLLKAIIIEDYAKNQEENYHE